MEHLSGKVPASPQEQQQLEAEGFTKCRVPTCNYMISPVEFSDAENDAYYFKCPSCKITYQLIAPTPFTMENGGVRGNPNEAEDPNANIEGINRNWETFVGLTMKQQGDIAEEIVRTVDTLGKYGPITSWSKTYNDPIDGTAGEWAIEVKSLNVDAKNHKFVPGSPATKQSMIARAAELGCTGILGVLVMLDYRKSLADIYAREMPLIEYTLENGKKAIGPIMFYREKTPVLIKEVSFNNPFMNPIVDNPQAYNVYEDIPF